MGSVVMVGKLRVWPFGFLRMAACNSKTFCVISGPKYEFKSWRFAVVSAVSVVSVVSVVSGASSTLSVAGMGAAATSLDSSLAPFADG